MDGMKILIISPDTDFRENAAGVLNEAGFQIEFASEINCAAEKTLEGSFDVLLLDLSHDFDENMDYLEKISKDNTFDFIIWQSLMKKMREKAAKRVDLDVCSYLESPLKTDELKLMVDNIIKVSDLKKEVREKEEKLHYFDIVNEISRKNPYHP